MLFRPRRGMLTKLTLPTFTLYVISRQHGSSVYFSKHYQWYQREYNTANFSNNQKCQPQVIWTRWSMDTPERAQQALGPTRVNRSSNWTNPPSPFPQPRPSPFILPSLPLSTIPFPQAHVQQSTWNIQPRKPGDARSQHYINSLTEHVLRSSTHHLPRSRPGGVCKVWVWLWR